MVRGSLLSLSSDDGFGRKRTSLIRRVSSWGRSRPPEPWRVGGCYAVGRPGVRLHRGPDLAEPFGEELPPSECVFLLTVDDAEADTRGPLGLVLPVLADGPGWLMLEDPPANGGQSGDGPLKRGCLKDSWEVGARYTVNSVATLRRSPSLTSDVVGEAKPGEEVLVLDIGVNDADPDSRARLRAMVRLPDGPAGWLSPRSQGGDRLLGTENLLGAEVVTRHRASLALAGGGLRRSLSAMSSRVRAPLAGAQPAGAPPAGPRRSFELGRPAPWRVGGRYRLLERAPLRARPSLSGAEAGHLPAGCLVTVQELHLLECRSLGWCPCCYVEVEEGPEAGREGWLRTAAADGRDLLDTRDQDEYADLLESLRAAQEEEEAAAESPDEGSTSGEAAPLHAEGRPPEQGAPEDQQQQQQQQQQHRGRAGSKLRCEALCTAGLLQMMSKPCGLAKTQRAKLLSD